MQVEAGRAVDGDRMEMEEMEMEMEMETEMAMEMEMEMETEGLQEALQRMHVHVPQRIHFGRRCGRGIRAGSGGGRGRAARLNAAHPRNSDIVSV